MINQNILANRYRIIQKLGSGGFGDTFLAEDTHAVYQDTNGNQIQDTNDKGFFNPASTVKVTICALVL